MAPVKWRQRERAYARQLSRAQKRLLPANGIMLHTVAEFLDWLLSQAQESLDRDKLLAGIRISCAKRPVSAAEIERLVGEIESALQAMGRAEVSSRVVGDMVIAGLKEMDQVAYIRYAIVYLGLDDLRSIRDEIDHLLES